MTAVLESYVTGKWVAPEGDTVPLINAVNGTE
jgi:oxepin-CoA hydrolase / 3-oxo-5,6-dehydrosuberyl-CoA semialdehyde dehydrogenase